MRSRTSGAPTLPIKSENDLAAEAELTAIHMEAGSSPEDAKRLAEGQVRTYGAAGAADLARQYRAPGGMERLEQAKRDSAADSARQDKWADDYNRATGAPGYADPGPLDSDVLPGDEPGTERVWNPATSSYNTRRKGPQSRGPEPDPKLGSRWGGGRPFASPAEREAYRSRPTLAPEARQAMVDAGATPEEIADAEASQEDKDMRAAGRGSPSGWAPVWVDGRVVMMQRAPTPTANSGGPGEPKLPEGYDPPMQPTSSDTVANMRQAESIIERGVADQAPIALGRDGLPVGMAGYMPGTANAATDNATTGRRAENRDVPPSLRRPDLEGRGYEAVYMQGPNGGEWVYQLSESKRKEMRYKNEADRAARTTSRLRVKAGVGGAPGEHNDNQLRELIAQKRADDLQKRRDNWNLSAMLRAGNNVAAQGMEGLNDWQRQMLAGGPTPLDVQARSAEMASRMAQQAMTAFLTNNPGATPEQRAMMANKMRDANPSASGASDIAAGSYETPHAQAEFKRLAVSLDTTTLGYSVEDERALAQALQRPPYNMPQAEAEAYAYRYAEKERYLNGEPPPPPPAR
jgi:hypothetical protein